MGPEAGGEWGSLESLRELPRMHPSLLDSVFPDPGEGDRVGWFLDTSHTTRVMETFSKFFTNARPFLRGLECKVST